MSVTANNEPRSAAQDWLANIPVMQQSVLLSAVRGPDGFAKGHPAKGLIRWYRRCVLVSAFDGKPLTTPYHPGGGDFTGPTYALGDVIQTVRGGLFHALPGNWPQSMEPFVDMFVRARDEMTLHYYAHAMHAFQILGVHHPDKTVALFWVRVYVRMVNALHLNVETEEQLESRLGDDPAGWRARSDEAGSCSA